MCDKILNRYAGGLLNIMDKMDLVGRFTGQQFLVLMLDKGPKAAMKKCDSWRQTVEKTVYLHNDEPINITTTGIMVEIDANESDFDLLERLIKGMAEAKKSGPNSLVFDDGKSVKSVEFPNLNVEEQEIVI